MPDDARTSAADVSVVVPLYNKAPYIERCINSILNQRLPPRQILVIDDGSTDGGAELVERRYGIAVHVIRQKNAGVSRARNLGAAMSSQPYVAFLDADDEWRPTYIEEVMSLASEFPQCALFATAYDIADELGQRSDSSHNTVAHGRGIIADYFSAAVRGWSPFCSSSVTFRRNTFLAIGGFNAALGYGEDIDLWVRTAIATKIAYVSKPLAIYHQGVANNVTKSFVPKRELAFVYRLESLMKSGKIEKRISTSINKFIARSLQYIVCENAKRGNYGAVCRYLFDRRTYRHFSTYTLKMWLAIITPIWAFNYIKAIGRRYQ